MWLEGRETGPINSYMPYLAITASNWPLGTALQQHHTSCNSAGERDGGWATSQNRCKMGRSNPSFSHLLLYSFPSKQADHAMEKSAGGSFSQGNPMGWYIVLMMIWIWVHKEKLNLLSSSTSLQMPATRPASRHWQLAVITDWEAGVGESDQEAESYPAFPSKSGFWTEKELQIGLVKNSILFLGPKYIIISTCPQSIRTL